MIKENPNLSSTVFYDKKINMCIRVEIDLGDDKLKYFKLYDNWDYTEASKVARISFLDHDYVFDLSDKHEAWTLKIEDKKRLIEIFESDDHSIWKHAIRCFNNESAADVCDLDQSEFDTDLNLMNDLKWPCLLPIDLPMPDYVFLPKRTQTYPERIVYLTQNQLLVRNGWTKSIFKKLKIEPDKTKHNPVYGSKAPMKLFSVARILEIESTEEFKKMVTESQPRKIAAAKAVETKFLKSI